MVAIEIELEDDVKIEETPTTLLFYFLYKVGHHDLCASILCMFTCNFALEETLSAHSTYFKEAKVQFDDYTSNEAIIIEGNKYVHFNFITSSEKK